MQYRQSRAAVIRSARRTGRGAGGVLSFASVIFAFQRPEGDGDIVGNPLAETDGAAASCYVEVAAVRTQRRCSSCSIRRRKAGGKEEKNKTCRSKPHHFSPDSSQFHPRNRGSSFFPITRMANTWRFHEVYMLKIKSY